MRYSPNQTQGFTLIELIMVIVILGILSAFALPRFADFSDQARLSTLRAVKGSLNSTVAIIRSEAMLQGHFSTTGPIDMVVNGNTIRIYNQGAPREMWVNGFENFIDVDVNHLGLSRNPNQNTVCTGSTFCLYDGIRMTNLIAGKGGFGMAFFPEGYSLSDECYAYYAFQIAGGLLEYIEAETEEAGC